jgi:hypothetical protein
MGSIKMYDEDHLWYGRCQLGSLGKHWW